MPHGRSAPCPLHPPQAAPEVPTLIKGSGSSGSPAIVQQVPATTDALVLPEGFLTAGAAKSGEARGRRGVLVALQGDVRGCSGGSSCGHSLLHYRPASGAG